MPRSGEEPSPPQWLKLVLTVLAAVTYAAAASGGSHAAHVAIREPVGCTEQRVTSL
jgi:hypothetical protein